MYLVGYGVQSSAWHIRVPAAEYMMLNHYGPNSTVRTVLDVLYNIMDEIDNSRKFKKRVSFSQLCTLQIIIDIFAVVLQDTEQIYSSMYFIRTIRGMCVRSRK